jgi:hypothetical protein
MIRVLGGVFDESDSVHQQRRLAANAGVEWRGGEGWGWGVVRRNEKEDNGRK